MPKKKKTHLGLQRKYARFPRPDLKTPPSSASDSQDSQDEDECDPAPSSHCPSPRFISVGTCTPATDEEHVPAVCTKESSSQTMDTVLECNQDFKLTAPIQMSPDCLVQNLKKVLYHFGPDGWTVRTIDDVVCLIFVSAQRSPHVSRMVHLFPEKSYTVIIHGRVVSTSDIEPASVFPATIKSLLSVLVIVQFLTVANACCGNSDRHFISLPSHSASTYVDKDYGSVDLNGNHVGKTVRSSQCNILCQTLRCTHCTKVRRYLRVKVHRQTSIPRSPSKLVKVNYRYLTREQLSGRVKCVQKEREKMAKQLQRIKAALASDAIVLDDDISNDMKGAVSALSEEGKIFPSDFKNLFWEEQRKAASRSGPQGNRWHPLIIRWCLYIRSHGCSGYNALRNSGMLNLPSLRTLQDYSQWSNSQGGFHVDTLNHMAKEAKIGELQEYERQVALLMDEVKIKSDLVFNKHSGRLVGFVDVESINNDLEKFEKRCSNPASTSTAPPLATHMMAFMVRGICTKFRYEMAHFPCENLKAEQLYVLFWKAVRLLESFGFGVLAVTGDGASTNRKFFRMHGRRAGDGPVYKTPNPYPPKHRAIFFFSDVPHLLKTVRNCWANSYAHKNSRKLWNDGKHITWKAVTDLYNEDLEREVRLLPKLQYEHVHLTSHALMRVNLAAQVMSDSVASAMELKKDPQLDGTIKFVRYINKFFDCMNVRSLDEASRSRNPDKAPYTSVEDSRFSWLNDEFLAYLEKWEKSIEEREGNFEKKDREAMCLSRETLEGLRITVHSYVEMASVILSMPGCRYLLSAKLNQDPLEGEFSKHRQGLGGSNNPSVQEFNIKSNLLRVQRSQAVASFRGNTKPEEVEETIDSEPLPKRRYLRN